MSSCGTSTESTFVSGLGGSANFTSAICAILNSYEAGNVIFQTAAPASGTTGNDNILNSIGALESALGDLQFGVDAGWLIITGAMVFLMHGGFAMLCAGSIRSKNAMNILLQTILDACASGIAWYCVGYGFAFGEGDYPNPFIGNALYGLARYDSHFTASSTPNGLNIVPYGSGFNNTVNAVYLGATPDNTKDGRWQDWFYQWAFAATATTIPAGSVAERFNFNAYLGYTWFIAGWIYPVVVHWAWSRQGWMTYFVAPAAPATAQTPAVGDRGRVNYLLGCGYIDFAGSGVVHMVGGTCGLVGALLVGPRLGRFDASGKPVDLPGHSSILVVLGTILLWFGWYGFNPGSVFIIDNAGSGVVAARAAVCTTLSGCAGGLFMLVVGFLFRKAWSVVDVCNGTLVGFVAITCCCHVFEPWAAIICGCWGCFWFELICRLLLFLKIDDPLAAAPMHMGGGAAGLFLLGCLAKMDYVYQAYGRAPWWGLFYRGGGMLLACQCIGICVIFGWCFANMFAFLMIFKVFGRLRIPVDEEQRGLDASKHGGSAYNGEEVAAQMLRFASEKPNKVAPDV